MNCDNFFCIYQSKGKCKAKNIRIDSLGMCTECVYPNICKELVEQAKYDLLKNYEQQEKR